MKLSRFVSLRFIVMVLIASCLATSYSDPAKGDFDEYNVKAIFIEKIYSFVKPLRQNESLSRTGMPLFCVIGKNPVEEKLNRISGLSSNGEYPFAIRRVSLMTEIPLCDLLFISASEKENLEAILSFTNSARPILTVSDTDGFARRGVVINILVESDKLRFEVNLKVAKSLGFEINSEVLKLAKIIDK